MNGSGKTTLLSIVAGFKKHTRGELEVFGEKYGKDNVLSLRKRIGLVSSSFFDKYYTNESSLDIVLSGFLGTFCPGYEISDDQVVLAKEVLSHLNLKSKINYPFSLLSKGERQNVLIARAFVAKPELLLLDEPGTGLDMFARELMLKNIYELADKTNVTIIYVTHYPEEILDIFENCLLLKNGLVYSQGKTREIMDDEHLSNLLNCPVQVITQNMKFQVNLTIKSELNNLL